MLSLWGTTDPWAVPLVLGLFHLPPRIPHPTPRKLFPGPLAAPLLTLHPNVRCPTSSLIPYSPSCGLSASPPTQVPYVELGGRILVMAVYDFDRFSRKDAIGEVRVAMSSVDLGRPVLSWQELQAIPREEVSTCGPASAAGHAHRTPGQSDHRPSDPGLQPFYLLQRGTLLDCTTGVLTLDLTIPRRRGGKKGCKGIGCAVGAVVMDLSPSFSKRN